MQAASNVLHVAGTVSTATAVAVCVALASEQIFAPVVAVLEVVATTAIANVLVGWVDWHLMPFSKQLLAQLSKRNPSSTSKLHVKILSQLLKDTGLQYTKC